MKIREWILMAAIAALAAPATVSATGEQGGAGETSGGTSSESGYTVQESTPGSELPVEEMNDQQTGEDQGGAGATSGEPASETGATDESGDIESDPAASPPTETSDEGGAGTTSGTLVQQIEGVIDSVDSARRSLTIRDDQGNLMSYTLEPGAEITVNERDASMAALSNGAPVTITVSDEDPTAASAVKVRS